MKATACNQEGATAAANMLHNPQRVRNTRNLRKQRFELVLCRIDWHGVSTQGED